LADAGVQPWDDEDYQPSPSRHNYLGPGMSLSQSQGGQNKAVNIAKAQRPNPLGENNSPLTESVQENFRGFTYTGESVMVSSFPPAQVGYEGLAHANAVR
jgi:protein-serine/threonine kinase